MGVVIAVESAHSARKKQRRGRRSNAKLSSGAFLFSFFKGVERLVVLSSSFDPGWSLPTRFALPTPRHLRTIRAVAFSARVMHSAVETPDSRTLLVSAAKEPVSAFIG